MKNENPDIKVEIKTRENGSRRVVHYCQGETLTRQSEAEATDINKIVNRYIKTGQWSHVAESMPWYGDVTEVSDYRDALDKVIAAEHSFMQLPAEVRKEFDNDPGKLIEFLQDDKNRDKAISLGLITPSVKNEKAPEQPKVDGQPPAGKE